MPIAWALALALQPPPTAAPWWKAAACTDTGGAGIAPADMLQRLDDFRAGLSAPIRQRLDKTLPRDASSGIAQCDGVERSRAACEVAAYMPALRRTRLMPRFLATICPAKTAAETKPHKPVPPPRPALPL